MTDMGLTSVATVGCPSCGAQNERTVAVCRSCGQPLAEAADLEMDRGDLELEEAVRALSAEGYDEAFVVSDGDVSCTECHAVLPLSRSQVEGASVVRDTATARTDLVIVAVDCEACGARGYIVGTAEDLAVQEESPHDEPSDHLTRTAAAETFGGSDPAKMPETPLDDRQHFVVVADGDTRSLRERGPLLDEDGTDIREYTGEPVETEEGTVIPQQQNVGPGNEAGGGEWPDPNAPSSQPR